jgi:bacteriorhodopsin
MASIPNPIQVLDQDSAASSEVPTKKTLVDIEKKPESQKPKATVQYYVKFSFTITYILLLTTATITFIEAIRTPNPVVRHVLNLETCISVVAGYFYSVFVSQIDKYSADGVEIDWAEISKTRYIDWSITTPMMLLALCVVLSNTIGLKVTFPIIAAIIALNYAMLYIGYLGETQKLSRFSAMLGGFVPFVAMFYLIYRNYVSPKYSLANMILFGLYFAVWSCYGFVYMLSESYKNIAMNILDLTAKCMIGLGLWVYYTHIVRL